MKKEKKRKALAATVCGSMLAIALVGGTLAYLQDTDSDVNVMTLGNVDIEQIEQERVDTTELPTAENNLKAFTQAKPLYPAVYEGASIPWDAASEADQAWKVVQSNDNVVDKFVTVKNTSKSAAYVRTLIAYEGDETYGPEGKYIHIVHNGTNVNPAIVITCIGAVNVKGVDYTVYEYVYPEALAAGETSIPSLKQVYMDKAADNGVVAKYGDTYDILVLSQAVQADGFTDAQTALDTAFGKASEKAAEWFGDVSAPVMVSTAAELQTAIDAAVDGDTIVLGADIEGDVTVTQKPNVKITLDGNGKTLAGVLLVDGKSGTYLTAGLTIKNLTFKAETISADACIQLGDGTNATRYTCNVTVENCTFDVPGAVGVKSYIGGDKNLTITGCTATANAHSLAQLKGIDGVLVESCTVNSVRGINLNNSLNVTIKDSTFDVQKYAVRFGESANTVVEVYEIVNCQISSQNIDGDAAIVLRAGATNAKLTLTNTTITATTTMSGHENANIVTN